MRLQRLITIGLTAAFLFLTLLVFNAYRPKAGDVAAGSDLNTQLATAIPREPPIASKISFGSLDELGEVTITGASGAVLPSANVLLVNVNTTHQDFVTAKADGSFQAKLFAPPGSFITIKHGPDHKIWKDTALGATQPGLTVFPSTTIYRAHTQIAGPNMLPFADAGAIKAETESRPTSIDAAWTITGTVGPINNLHPGDKILVEATIRLYSQAISSTTDVSAISLHMEDTRPWLMLFDENGNPLPSLNQAGSSRLTPGGLPILDGRQSAIWNTLNADPISWAYAKGNIIEGKLSLEFTLDKDMPPGVYRPTLGFDFQGVPAGSGWVSALLSTIITAPPFTFNPAEVALPPLEVKKPSAASSIEREDNQVDRLIWYLLMDHVSQGTRGTGAIEDRYIYQPSSFVATQGAPYVISRLDPLSGDPAAYRLEPYLPMINWGRGAMPGPPLLPFNLPGGELCVTVHEPNGQMSNLGCDEIAQSVSGDESTPLGDWFNLGAFDVTEYYGLTTASDNFVVSFVQSGHHVVEMSGWVEDVWGNRYEGGGTYDLYVAHSFDIDPGLLPGTPLAVGEAINPTVQLQPRLPARVNLTITHFPDSDPGQMQTVTTSGWANRFGYFAHDGPPLKFDKPGEYRLDLTAQYLDPESGEMVMGAITWGGVVMTPPGQATLIAHGRRGSDNLKDIPGSWFDFCDINPPEDSTPHIFNPYLNGDIIWSHPRPVVTPGCVGDALLLGASVRDSVGTVETAIQDRFNRPNTLPLHFPGDIDQRVQFGELPLFSSTKSGRPVSLVPGETDQIAYAYLSSQRPGVRVREGVAEDGPTSGYWRLDSMYENQPGVGIDGDLPNDFKYQFVGVVYRDLVSGLSEYLGQGSGWVHTPVTDTECVRFMPPFSGPGNGGWPTAGGPLMTLKGKKIHMFILPTGVRPGGVLQVGDRFDFAGHIMPTLDSQVEATVTAPSGKEYIVIGRANQVGYFFEPEGGFIVNEPGRWTVNVQVWHDGRIGSGDKVDCDADNPFDLARPCPSGDVLGSTDGRYAFYVVSAESSRLLVTAPIPGRLTFDSVITPITISGPLPTGVTNAVVDYTISMPGFILKEGKAKIESGGFSLTFDPNALNKDFPNLDLKGRHGDVAGLSDTFSIGLLLTGRQGGEAVYQAATLTIQGDQVYVERAVDVPPPPLYLPVVSANN